MLREAGRGADTAVGAPPCGDGALLIIAFSVGVLLFPAGCGEDSLNYIPPPRPSCAPVYHYAILEKGWEINGQPVPWSDLGWYYTNQPTDSPCAPAFIRNRRASPVTLRLVPGQEPHFAFGWDTSACAIDLGGSLAPGEERRITWPQGHETCMLCTTSTYAPDGNCLNVSLCTFPEPNTGVAYHAYCSCSDSRATSGQEYCE